MMMKTMECVWVALCLVTSLRAAPVAWGDAGMIDLSEPRAMNRERIPMGSSQSPRDGELTVNGISLLHNNQPWLGVMGEFHFSRYPQAEWREELLKMKAGGIDIVSTYVFWIHHEETEGNFDWTAQRDLRAFAQLCDEVGLRLMVRCGPWDHGEVRQGGFPDWLLTKGYKLRSNDPGYLQEVRRLYGQIAQQLKGLLWKDGGPVIGIQLENEYHGDPQHLLTLKQLGIDAGLDVPMYTRTGWPELPKPMPFGKLLPLYGGYAEGFWDRKLQTMPGKYWSEFVFKYERTDAAIANDHFGTRPVHDEAGTQNYPYLTCELGAGMMNSYHRRINVFPQDCVALPIVKLGCGSNLPGYYMYHGGTNPDGNVPMQESQRTSYTNYNDLPTKSYDFQTALGEFGQVRPQYHLLRRLHLFVRDFGAKLATMPTFIPERQPSGKDDDQTLRWSVRSDGKSGFLFVNNYQRLQPMPAKHDVTFKLKLRESELTVPRRSITIPADSTFIWPFNLDLGVGAVVTYATCQPVCQVVDGSTQITVFATTGVPPEFAFDSQNVTIDSTSGTVDQEKGLLVVQGLRTGTDAAIKLHTSQGGQHAIVLLDERDSLACWKGKFGGKERILLTPANAVIDGPRLRLSTSEPGDISFAIIPAGSLRSGGETIASTPDGIFQRFTIRSPQAPPVNIDVKQIQQAGPAREVPIGVQKVAQAPVDADFESAAVWHITLPPDLDATRRLLLRIGYAGDVARAYSGDKLLTDDFYNGAPFDVGVNRFAAEIAKNGVKLKILPLRKDAPIYMLDSSRPDFAAQQSVAAVNKIEVVEEHTVELQAAEANE
jgi:beta-galactosidase